MASARPRHAARLGSGSADLRAALDDIERLWAHCGHPRSPHSGLREHLDAIPAGVLSPDARRTSAAVVTSYYEACFGGRAPSNEELAALRRAPRTLG